MKIHKNIEFLLPFIYEVKDIVPLEKLNTIRAYKVDLYKEEQAYGSIVQCGRRKNINLRISSNSLTRNVRRPIHLMILLDSLAHELAHIVHWKHTPDHLLLQLKILKRFALFMKKIGVKETYSRVKVKV